MLGDEAVEMVRVFSDPDVFEQEMELIFGRAWLFVAHETMIGKAGDFFEAPMGKDNVLVVRQRDGSIKALSVNTATPGNNLWRNRPEAPEALGPIGLTQGGHPKIFPTAGEHL